MKTSTVAIDDLTEFEIFSSDSIESTTSDLWITKTGYPYTTTLKTTGTYILDYSCNMTNSLKQKGTGTRVQYRELGDVDWITIQGSELLGGVNVSNEYILRTGFHEIEVTADVELEIRWQFGQTTSGGTGRIKDASVKIAKAT